MKYIYHTFKVLLLLIFVQQADAQQLPLYSQYWWNDYLINPAYTGSLNYSPLQMTFRKQWVGFNGSPELFTLGGHTRFSDKVAIGGLIFKDQTGGAITQTGVIGNYSYRIKMNETSHISLALSGQFNQYTFENSKVQALAPGDPALMEGIQKSMSPDASFGILYQNGQKTKIGFSINQLFESRINNLNENDNNNLVRHFNISASKAILIDSNFTFEPSVLIKKTASSPTQVDLMGRVKYKNFLWAGVSYRYQDAMVALLGLSFKNMFLGYSYDVTMSEISTYSSGSHEIVFGFMIGNKQVKVLADIDKDGVADSIDHCPTIAGVLENFGCPFSDKDKDGTPDYLDKCPELFGDAKSNGCPTSDKDNDGILDYMDKCPELAGDAKNNGCPVPDKDADGIPDDLDNCPNTKGTNDNNGCPVVTAAQKDVVSKAITNLEFESNKATIKQESFLGLDMLAVLLAEKPDWKLKLAGHTDDVGGDEVNMQLSKDRAESVQNYLVNKGISSSRFIVEYYGKTKPISSNNNDAGRKLNRRVEMSFVFE
jgi:type IX secretion system PorP/SprF family membrane protein